MNTTTAGARTEWRRNWPMVAAGASAMSLAALATSSFGVMLLPIEQDLGWSRTRIASGPLLISLMIILLATLMGAAIDRIGPRLIASAATALLCTALALLSRIDGQVWAWWLLWGAIGVASAAIPTSLVTTVSQSFSAGRGLAIAIVLSGSGISSFVVPSLTNALVEAYGWRLAYLCLAGIWGVIVLPLVLLYLRPARDLQAPTPFPDTPVPDTATMDKRPVEALPGLTVRQAFAAPVFYKLLLGTFASTFAGTALVLNLVPLLNATGLTGSTAAGVAGSVGIATIVGRIAGGGLLDRFKGGSIAATVSLLAIALPAGLLLVPGSIPGSIAAVFIYGMMGGALTPAIAYLASRYLGQRNFGTLYATIMAVMSIGVGLGPLLANAVYDRVQSYEPVLWATIPMFALGALLYASLGPYPDFASPQKPD